MVSSTEETTDRRQSHRGEYPRDARRLCPKRIFDFVVSILALTAALPFMVLIALLIVMRDGFPIFYCHERVGQHGRRFQCRKFRTMVCNADAVLEAELANNSVARGEWIRTRKLRRDPRVLGRTGRLIRRLSLDELPQLFNVLKGEMSLVGPRPVTAEELPSYGPSQGLYLAARPGLTGLWQISGRSDTDFGHRVELDVRYLTNPSLLRDTWILLKTLTAVVSGRGAY